MGGDGSGTRAFIFFWFFFSIMIGAVFPPIWLLTLGLAIVVGAAMLWERRWSRGPKVLTDAPRLESGKTPPGWFPTPYEPAHILRWWDGWMYSSWRFDVRQQRYISPEDNSYRH